MWNPQPYLESRPSQPRRPHIDRHETSASVDSNDLNLVRRAQRGEREAFDLLVMKYRHRVVQLVLRYTRNPFDAEDATQEAFIKAFVGLKQFRCESAFYTWLHRIAINCAKNLLKARAHEPPKDALVALGADESTEVPIHLRNMETPEDLRLTEDVYATVNAALVGLPEAQRAAIMLREIDGLSYARIGAVMGTPIGTVRSRVFRARQFIDQQLRQLAQDALGCS